MHYNAEKQITRVCRELDVLYLQHFEIIIGVVIAMNINIYKQFSRFSKDTEDNGYIKYSITR